jgi:hypothetical protein
MAQPVRTLLGTWGRSVPEVATFSARLAIPWALKPLYGLLSDFVPLAGSRRKGYLIVTSAVHHPNAIDKLRTTLVIPYRSTTRPYAPRSPRRS